MSDPMEALRARFLARLGEDREALRSGDPDGQAAAAHRLAGAAGVFGFEALGRAALVLDDRWRAEGRISPQALADLIEELERALKHG